MSPCLSISDLIEQIPTLYTCGACSSTKMQCCEERKEVEEIFALVKITTGTLAHWRKFEDPLRSFLF